MLKHVFGPVPSRRLGISLGVDLVPRKICSFDCVYCECGATTKLTAERKEYVPVEQVKQEIASFLNSNPPPEYVTLSGSGEPTLNIGFGEVIRFISSGWPEVPVAVLTNGSLLCSPDVRKDLMQADLVLPSLDAGSQEVFERINVPVPGMDIEEYTQGLVDFRAEFPGEIWLETLILPGYNDSDEELDLMKAAFQRISPDRIQINTLDRPGRIPGLKAASMEELERIKNYWNLSAAEIIAPAQTRKEVPSYSSNIEETILGTVRRRPCTVQDLSAVLGLHVNEVNKYLAVMEEQGAIKQLHQKRGVFYTVSR
ncbi:MAG: radical SAM protein [Gemmatimonadaceae bacterium 4484_173]|nr:MAG: radical SAM protein [Gemmatimonadaceae bacterium 4484_173]RKZ01620.1 MAG: radical SAM protein [Candidatus Fermentibacteria bacterium]